MINIFLVRHGQTTYNADGNRYCGITDVELTPTGIGQAEDLAKMLAGVEFEAIYSSPLTRAITTAEIITNSKEITVDERLRELDFGSWEGKARAEFIKTDPVVWDRWNEDPEINPAGGDGETARQLLVRLDEFQQEILSKHSTGNILVVAHNGVNRFLIAKQLGIPLRNYRKLIQENSTLTLLRYEAQEGVSLVKLNCTGEVL